MADLAMNPTWGALEDALAPQRREVLMRLLSGKSASDPTTTPLWGEEEAPTPVSFPAEAKVPAAAAPAPEPAFAPAPSAPRAAPMSIYDTPYGEAIRQADEEVKGAFWGYQHDNARRDRDRLTQLAVGHIARVEGRSDLEKAKSSAERASENALAREVLQASDRDQAGIRKERIAQVQAGTKRFTRGTPVDRGEDGVWQEVRDNETGESEWIEIPLPSKRAAKAPTVHGLGAGGGVYFDAQGRPQRIAPFRSPGEPPSVPSAVVTSVMERLLRGIDPKDPQALPKVMMQLRELGLVPGGGPSPGAPAPARASLVSSHAPAGAAPSAAAGTSSSAGGTARPGAGPQVTFRRDPRSGKLLRVP